MSRRSAEEEDGDTAVKRCKGTWTWRDDRNRLEFLPESSAATGGGTARKRQLRASATTDVSANSAKSAGRNFASWPSHCTRVTWPSLALVWDSFGTEPETPSRHEVPPVVQASRNWLRACHAPLASDMQTRPGRVGISGIHMLQNMRRSMINIPLSRQASSIGSRQISQVSMMTNQSDPSMASSPIKHSSAAVVAAKLTYAREGPVTLDIVKEVAMLELDYETECTSVAFFDLYKRPLFDKFLMAALRYINSFIRLKAIEVQLEGMVSEMLGTSKLRAAKKDKKQIEGDVEIAKRKLAVHYSSMLLPHIESYQGFHHTGAGAWRTSRTNADQMLQEAIFRFATAVVWIAMGRQQWTIVATELGRLFRGDEFNISGRLASRPSEQALEAGRLHRRRTAASGGPVLSYVQRNPAFARTKPIATAVKMTSPLMSCLMSPQDLPFQARSSQREDRELGILGKPVLDFTPFLEPKPEVKRADTEELSDSASEATSSGGEENSEPSDDESCLASCASLSLSAQQGRADLPVNDSGTTDEGNPVS